MEKIIDKYLEYLYTFCKNEQLFTYLALEEIFYDCFEEIYIKTLESLREQGYIISDKPIDFLSLVWDKDTKKLEERIRKYITYHSSNKYYIPKDSFNVNFRDLSDLLENEALHMKEAVTYEKLKENYPFCEVIDTDDCCSHCRSNHKGIMKTEDLKEVPPFHPSCTCSIKYYTENEVDFDEVEDIL